MNTSLINIDEIYEEAKAPAEDDGFLVKKEPELSEEESSSLSEDQEQSKAEYLLKGETFMNLGPL